MSVNFECYYCDFTTDTKFDYERHVIFNHAGKLCYPGKADLEALGIALKGKWWET